MIYELTSEQETEAFGAELWQNLPDRAVIFLNGTLGAGKTTLVRGYLRAAGYQDAVKSPTYTLVEEYNISQRKVFHFDLYRLKDPEELEWIGIQDYFVQKAVFFVEWPEMGRGMLPENDYEIDIKIENTGRIVEFIKK